VALVGVACFAPQYSDATRCGSDDECPVGRLCSGGLCLAGTSPDGPSEALDAVFQPDAPGDLSDAALADGPLADGPRADAPRVDGRVDGAIGDAASRDARAIDGAIPDACGPCRTSSDCGASAPICAGCACTTCTSDPQCAERAAALGSLDSLCGGAGQCVQCRVDGDCGGPTPACSNDAGGTCVAPAEAACGSLLLSQSGSAAAPAIPAYDMTDSFTIEAWIYPTAFGAPDYIAHHSSAYALYLFGGGLPYFEVDNAAGEYIAVSVTPVPLNAWTHLAGTFDRVNQTVILWVNGQQAAMASAGPPRMLPTAPFIVGDGFQGLIDEVRLSATLRYNASFTPARSVPWTLPDDVAHFHFDEASGVHAIDASPNANDAVLAPGASFEPSCQYYRCGSVVTYGGYVTAPPIAALEPSGSFTLEAYVRALDLTGDGTYAINIVDRPGSYHLFVKTSTGVPAFEVACNGVWETVYSSTPLDHEWTHLAGVLDVAAQRVFLYQNGVLAAQSEQLSGCARADDKPTQPLIVASDFGGFWRFRGFVDELRLSSVARYSADFSAGLFQMPGLTFPNREGSTLALYHFDEAANPASDSSLENNPATVVVQGTDVNFAQACY
jgi:hypothetical protein